ncbi:hypothetical protein OTB19_42945, partial [Streptomyces sp. H27-H5]|nr:hypothetical protein [Streptomyces sp. H27-H5]
MSALPNHVLVEWMSDQKLGSRELAELVNKAVAELTGRPGGLDDSNIRAWRSGRVRCPKSVQLRALELVSGKSATDLVVCVVNPSGVDVGLGVRLPVSGVETGEVEVAGGVECVLGG